MIVVNKTQYLNTSHIQGELHGSKFWSTQEEPSRPA